MSGLHDDDQDDWHDPFADDREGASPPGSGADANDEEIRPSPSLQRLIHRIGARSMAMGSVRALLTPLFHGWYRECVQCGRLVGADGEPYYVERALRRGEPLFEYAMCDTCVFALQNELSRESIERVTAIWFAQFDFDARWRRLGESLDPGPLVESCVLEGTPRAELEEFQVWAWVADGRLVVDDSAPGILSGLAAERIAAVLSRSTRDRLDEFVRDRLGVPPELCTLPILV